MKEVKEFSFSKKCEKGKFRYRGRFLLLLNDEDFENEFFLFQKKGKIGKDFGKDFARFICLEKIADI